MKSKSPDTSTRLRFLGRDLPLLPLVVRHLTEAAAADGVSEKDFSSQLVIVPTRHAGRRLREGLALAAADGAIIPPRVVTPESFFSVCRPESIPAVASPVMSVMAWSATLLAADIASLPALFPVPPRQKNFRWARSLAQRLGETRKLLGEAGLTFAAACRCLPKDNPEKERWQQLAGLEKEALARLAAAGLTDADEAKAACAAAPRLPAGVQRVLLAGTPDPLPILIRALETIERERMAAVEVLVHAPASDAPRLDDWGRPYRMEGGKVSSPWLQAAIPLEDEAVHPCPSPREEAATIFAMLGGHDAPHDTAAVGVADPEILALLDGSQGPAALRFFDPEGRRASEHEVWHLLSKVSRLAADQSFAAFAALVRHPAAAWLVRKGVVLTAEDGKAWHTEALLRKLDAFQEDHLPGSLADAAARADDKLRPWLEAGLEMIRSAAENPPGKWIPEFLAAAYGDRTFSLEDAAGRDFAAVASELIGMLDETERATAAFSLKIDPADFLAVLLEHLSGSRLPAEHAENAVDLLGWLELAWEDAPHVIVAGCNDGMVPDKVDGDAFLPDGLRAALGLRSNATREARDAFLLTALAECRRKNDGRIDVVLAKHRIGGDPLRPSRLLLRRSGADLLSRTGRLFGESSVAEIRTLPAPSVCWKLQPPPPAEPLKSISVTGFKEFLQCPLRFYFKKILRMNPVPPASAEFDAAAFGSLCHTALERFGADPALRILEDPEKIHARLEGFIRDEVRARCGPSPPVPVLIQQQSAIRRLEGFAAWHAASVREGWQQQEAEIMFKDLHGEKDWQLAGLPLPITGKIDRIDFHPIQGWRILDFKTSDKTVEPAKSHLISTGKKGGPPDAAWRIWPDEKKPQRWADLQLPLYVLAFQDAHPGETVEAGYFHLARSTADCTYTGWPDLASNLLDNARKCAVGVLRRVLDGDFRTETRSLEHDDFGGILLDDAFRSVAPKFVVQPAS